MTPTLTASHRDLLEALTRSGPRVIGSVAADRAVELIRGELEAAGYVVADHRFQMPAWEPRDVARLEVKAPEQTTLECQPMLWSGATPAGGARGRLVALGHTRLWEGSYSWRKFAVVDGEALAAYVLVHEGGRAIVQPCPPGSDLALPHLVVGQDDGERLAGWLREDQVVYVVVEAPVQLGERGDCHGVSLVTSLPDHGTQAVRPLICAHYDTVFNTPGAYDNASGVVAVLELARRFTTSASPAPRFAFFGGEEWHLAGSRGFVADLCEDAAEISFVLNIDGIGRGAQLDVSVGPEWFEWAVHDAIGKHLGDAPVRVQTTFPPFLGSDHAPFYEVGIPAAHLTFNDWALLHRPEDLPTSESIRNIALVVDLAESLIRSLPSAVTARARDSTSVIDS